MSGPVRASRRLRPRAWLCATAASLLARQARAAAPETWPLDEAVEVDEARCLAKAELVPGVEAWLGRAAIDRRIQISVASAGDDAVKFVVRREGEPAAERRFRTSKIACADLRAAVALAIALAIDATVLRAIVEPEPAPEKAPPPRPAAPPPVAPPGRPSFEFQAHGIALVGVLPRPAFGGSLGAAVPVGRALAIRATAMATAETIVPVGAGTALVSLAAGKLDVCLERPLGALELEACGGLSAGRWSARGRGFDVDRSTGLPWGAAAAGLGLGLALGQGFALSGRADGYLPLLRPVLEETGPDGMALRTADAPAAGIVGSLGVTVAFP